MKKVLIVDDAAFMRLKIRDILEKNGYTSIEEASDGEEAFKKYKEFKPDVVTMDITMPQVSGLQALKAIIQYDPKAKVVMLSAMGQENMIKEAIISGAKTFIIKPFKDEYMLETLSKILAAN